MGFLPELRISKREEVPYWLPLKISLSSIAVSLAVLSILLASLGANPVVAYAVMFSKPIGTAVGLSLLGLRLIPILLCSAGLVLAFRAGVWNIGAEGQLLLGAIASTWLALYAMPWAPGPVVIPLMFIVGFSAGAAWALVPGLLKAKLGVNEVITTLMMNYMAMELVNYLIQGPWRGPYLFPKTHEIPPQARLPLLPGTSIHYPTLAIALMGALSVYVLMRSTKLGYEVKVVGSNPEAARYAGIDRAKVIALAMALSGGLAGVAGVGEVAGNPAHYGLYYPETISAGYGYTAIIVAWLSRLNPSAIPLSAFFVSLVLAGGHFLKAVSKDIAAVAHEVVIVFNGTVLLCLAVGELLTRYRISLRWGGGR